MASEIAKIYLDTKKSEEDRKAREIEENDRRVAVEAMKMYEAFKMRAKDAAAEGFIGLLIIPETFCVTDKSFYDLKIPINPNGYIYSSTRTFFGSHIKTLTMSKALSGLILILKRDGYVVQSSTSSGANIISVRWDKVKPRGPEPSAPLKSVETETK